MERILVKNLIRGKTCYNCEYRSFDAESCIYMWFMNVECNFEKIPKNNICEKWLLRPDLLERKRRRW